MRCAWLLIVMALLVLLAGCATPRATPHKLVGRVKIVSQRDIQVVTAFTRRQMQYAIGWAVPIDRIEISDRDHITVVYLHNGYTNSLPFKRVRGVWVPPPLGVTVTSGNVPAW